MSRHRADDIRKKSARGAKYLRGDRSVVFLSSHRKEPIDQSIRLSTVVKRHKDGTTLVQPTFLWPCLTCPTLVHITFSTYTELKQGQLLGVKCPDCLTPSPKPALVRGRNQLERQKGAA